MADIKLELGKQIMSVSYMHTDIVMCNSARGLTIACNYDRQGLGSSVLFIKESKCRRLLGPEAEEASELVLKRRPVGQVRT